MAVIIDIGAGAADYNTSVSVSQAATGIYTIIDKTNPANAGGTLTKFQIYLVSGNDCTGILMGTFSGSAPNYSVRDYETLGSVSSGSVQTFTGLSCTVSSGDFIGIGNNQSATKYVEVQSSGGSNVEYASGNGFTTGLSYSSLASYKLGIYGTYEVAAPTVTTQAVDTIANTSVRGNGNITSVDVENATRRGFCYLQGSSGDPTTANSVAYDDGDFGTGAYTKSITGLTAGLPYRVRAYAVNAGGTGYGTTVDVTTLKTDQHSFRFRDDDGSETTAAWLDALNTDITHATETPLRLRLLVDTTGDQPSQGYQLEHRKNAGAYGKTNIGATTLLVPALVTKGTAGDGSGTSVTAGAPASLASGNVLILTAYSSDAADVMTAHVDWGDALFQIASSTGRLAAWAFKYTDTSPTNYTVSRTGSGETFVAGCAQFSNIDVSGAIVRATGSAGAGTDDSMEHATVTPTAGDLILAFMGASDDNDVSALAGWSFAFDPGAGNNYASTAGAPDAMVSLAYKVAATGDATGTVTFTQSASDPWASILVVLKVASAANEVYITLSDNIAASAATATTAQLTAPSGKSGNFTAGKISDDTNPITVDVASSYYTELEWCVELAAALSTDDEIEFRVTVAGTAFDAYTQVPMIIVGTSGTTYEESCTDGIKLGDTPTHTLTLSLTLSDGITLGGTMLTNVSFYNTLTDGVKLGEALLTNVNIQELLTDGVLLGETQVFSVIWEGVLTDGIKLGDSVSHTYETNPELTDGIALGDTPLTQVIFDCTLTDGTVLSDTLLENAVFQQILSDGILLGESVIPNRVIYLSLTDGIKLSDQPSTYSATLNVYIYERGLTILLKSYTLVINLNNHTLEMRLE